MTPQELNTKIAKIKATGSPLTEDQLRVIILKKEAGASKRAKRSEKSWADREVRSQITGTVRDTAEMFRENARKNLPSWMRD